MKTVILIFTFVSLAQLSLATTGLWDFAEIGMFDHLVIGNLHASLGFLGVLFFAVSVLLRLQRNRGR